MIRYLLLLALIAAAADLSLVFSDRASESSNLPVGRLQLGNSPDLFVEIADTPQSRARGEMDRDHVRLDGMFFVYRRAHAVEFWMKDTRMPLDIVFVGPDHRVIRVARHAMPESLAHIPSGGPVSAVLELPAGRADDWFIRVGDQLGHWPQRLTQ